MPDRLKGLSMKLYDGADGVSPGVPLPPGTDILSVYIGAKDLPARPDALHIWSVEECNLYLDPASHLYGGPQLRILPVFVHDYASGDAVLIARNMADAATDMGWSDKLRRIVMLDLETLVDRYLVSGIAQALWMLGFALGKYGSSGFINQNPAVFGGTWMALLANRQPTMLPAGAVGQQWQFGPQWDRSVFSQFVYDNCGQGVRKARP